MKGDLMKYLAVACLIVAAVFMSIQPGLGADDSCACLTIIVDGSGKIDTIDVIHGNKKEQTGTRIHICQSAVYGPDVDIEIKQRNGTWRSSYNVQQDFCFWSGGDITVTHKSGKTAKTKTVRSGSYGSSAGYVHLTFY